MESKSNPLLKIKFSSKNPLSREQLKNVKGGDGNRCPSYCFTEDNGPGVGCGVGQQCVEVACGTDPQYPTHTICV